MASDWVYRSILWRVTGYIDRFYGESPSYVVSRCHRAHRFGVGMDPFCFGMPMTIGTLVGFADYRTPCCLYSQPGNVQYIVEGGLDEHFSPDDGQPILLAPVSYDHMHTYNPTHAYQGYLDEASIWLRRFAWVRSRQTGYNYRQMTSIVRYFKK